jgi:hypothetical protein
MIGLVLLARKLDEVASGGKSYWALFQESGVIPGPMQHPNNVYALFAG